uniref:hypothetical protein n=1 Tax=Candidatus Ichthyocystis hellenicum TaxID=1561003 RepID=UPI00158552F7
GFSSSDPVIYDVPRNFGTDAAENPYNIPSTPGTSDYSRGFSSSAPVIYNVPRNFGTAATESPYDIPSTPGASSYSRGFSSSAPVVSVDFGSNADTKEGTVSSSASGSTAMKDGDEVDPTSKGKKSPKKSGSFKRVLGSAKSSMDSISKPARNLSKLVKEKLEAYSSDSDVEISGTTTSKAAMIFRDDGAMKESTSGGHSSISASVAGTSYAGGISVSAEGGVGGVEFSFPKVKGDVEFSLPKFKRGSFSSTSSSDETVSDNDDLPSTSKGRKRATAKKKS